MRKRKRESDPNHLLRQDYKQALHACGLYTKDWPLKLRRSKKHPQSASGHCYYRSHIAATIGISADRAEWVALFLHEAAHAQAGYGAGHGDKWRSIFVEAAASFVSGKDHPIAAPGSAQDLHAHIENWLRAKL